MMYRNYKGANKSILSGTSESNIKTQSFSEEDANQLA